jgi:hypothetical protein
MRTVSLGKLLAIGAVVLVVAVAVENYYAQAIWRRGIVGLRARAEAVASIKRFKLKNHHWPASRSESAGPSGVEFSLSGPPTATEASYTLRQGTLVKTVQVRAD